jgi:glycosyltransferase involved in cell wall biosynthesis
MLEAPADTERIRCVPRAEARAALGIGDEPLALYVGRIADEKRVQSLVEEFSVTARAVPGARLVLAGRGVKVAAVRRRAARLGLADRVQLLGPVGGDALGLWYSAASISVSASRSETGPLTVVEAMACGTPTVALRAPGFEDRVVDRVNGILAPDRPGALGDAMARVLSDAALRSRLAAGALESAPRYTPGLNTERLLALYEGLLE